MATSLHSGIGWSHLQPLSPPGVRGGDPSQVLHLVTEHRYVPGRSLSRMTRPRHPHGLQPCRELRTDLPLPRWPRTSQGPGPCQDGTDGHAPPSHVAPRAPAPALCIWLPLYRRWLSVATTAFLFQKDFVFSRFFSSTRRSCRFTFIPKHRPCPWACHLTLHTHFLSGAWAQGPGPCSPCPTVLRC